MPLNAPEMLDREFLEIRAQLLQVAAALDRIDRSGGSVEDDPRMARIREAIGVVLSGDRGRAERLQAVFSREYDPQWRAAFGLPPSRREGEKS